MSNFFKQTAQKAKDEAIKAARQFAQEPIEILKNTKGQVSGIPEKSQPDISVMQQVMTGDGKVVQPTAAEEHTINALAKRRLQEIEAELRALRQQREQRSVDYIKEQQEMMGEGKKEEKPQYVEAPGKPHHGPKNPAQRKQGTKEIGKQYSG